MRKVSLFNLRGLFFIGLSFMFLVILGVSADVHAASAREDSLNEIRDSNQEESFDALLFPEKLKEKDTAGLSVTRESLSSQGAPSWCGSYVPGDSDPSTWQELSILMDPVYTPDDWDYWWICRVPYNVTWSVWLYDYVLPDDILNFDGDLYVIFTEDAIPNKVAEGIYLSDYFDILVPGGSYWGSGLYHLGFWDFHANTPSFAGGFYFSKMFDTMVPYKWADAYYYKTLIDSAIPKKWTNGYWHRVFWDKAIPYKYKNAYYLKLFWDKLVPLKWANGYYARTFWASTVTQRWASGYYRNTLVYSARPGRWASGYYRRYTYIR